MSKKGPGVAPDIDPRSGSRLPPPKREELDADCREIYDMLSDPDGGSLAGLKGPGGIQLHSPALSVRMRKVTGYLRNESGIAPRHREIAILTTAREHDCRFEWVAHVGAARKAGVSDQIVALISDRGPLDGLDDPDAAIIAFGRELFGNHRVTPETYARLAACFERPMLVDLVYTMGSYAMTAAALIGFDAQVDPDAGPDW